MQAISSKGSWEVKSAGRAAGVGGRDDAMTAGKVAGEEDLGRLNLGS